MKIVKISATSSTNAHLKSMAAANNFLDEMVLVTENQLEGKGQMGNKWHSQQGKSLTVSVFKKTMLSIDKQFYLNMAVSLAVENTLKIFKIPDINIKWPNDILSANKKAGGILIENFVKSSMINGSVIGIGLNVNETELPGLPQATSLKMISGEDYDKKKILAILLQELETCFIEIKRENYEVLRKSYFQRLYKKDQVAVFKTPQSLPFNGIIRNVSESGKLQVETEDGIINAYDLKEIKMLL